MKGWARLAGLALLVALLLSSGLVHLWPRPLFPTTQGGVVVKAAEEAGKRLGAEAWEQAKALWGKLKPRVEAKPAAQEAVQDLAAHPADEDAQAALRLQLRKLLAEDEAMAREVQQILEAPAVRQVIAQGERSVAIGGDVSGSVIVTGDQDIRRRTTEHFLEVAHAI